MECTGWNVPSDPALLWVLYCATIATQPEQSGMVNSPSNSSTVALQLSQLIRHQLATPDTDHNRVLVETNMSHQSNSSTSGDAASVLNQCCMTEHSIRCRHANQRSTLCNHTKKSDQQISHFSSVHDFHKKVILTPSAVFGNKKRATKKMRKKAKKQTDRITLEGLSSKTLNKYIKHFANSDKQVRVNPAFGPAEKAQVLTNHLYSLEIDESDIINAFIQKMSSLKRNRFRLPRRSTFKDKKK